MALRPTRPQSRAEQLAQQQAAQQDVFLREVDEALREDQMFAAIRRYGKPVGAALVLGLAGLAGWLWWGNHGESLRAERGEQMTLALDQLEAGNLDAASQKLAGLAGTDASNSGDGSQAAARMLRAGIAAQQGHADQAAAEFGAIAQDSTAPQPYRDLATIRQVALTFDAMKPDTVIARLKPLAIPGAPWFGAAGELVGMAYVKQGHKDLAGPLFGAMAKDASLPDSLRARARQMAGLLGFDAIDDIARAPEPVPAVAAPAAPPADANPGAAPAAGTPGGQP